MLITAYPGHARVRTEADMVIQVEYKDRTKTTGGEGLGERP
jgi:hypothetical protein